MKTISTYNAAEYAASGTVGFVAFKKSYDLFKSNDKMAAEDGKDLRLSVTNVKDKSNVVVDNLNGDIQ